MADGRWHSRRSPAALAVVAVLHGVLVAALWATLRERRVTVERDRPALLWVQALRPESPAQKPPPAALRRPRAPARPPAPAEAPRLVRPPPADAPVLTLLPASAPSTATAPPAPASAPPAERLLDTEATRLAILQAARQPLLAERTAQALGEPIQRSDTGLAEGTAAAGKPDCTKMQSPMGLLGLPILAAMVASGKCTNK